jgi:hypothetical protein
MRARCRQQISPELALLLDAVGAAAQLAKLAGAILRARWALRLPRYVRGNHPEEDSGAEEFDKFLHPATRIGVGPTDAFNR